MRLARAQLMASIQVEDEEVSEETPILYIDPEECIDCGACEPARPVTAIFSEDAVTEGWNAYIAKN